MKKTPTRLRIVDGEAPYRRTRNKLSAFKCTQCTEELGIESHTMVQVLRSPHEMQGKHCIETDDLVRRQHFLLIDRAGDDALLGLSGVVRVRQLE